MDKHNLCWFLMEAKDGKRDFSLNRHPLRFTHARSSRMEPYLGLRRCGKTREIRMACCHHGFLIELAGKLVGMAGFSAGIEGFTLEPSDPVVCPSSFYEKLD